jgi:hypothetical protein
MAKASVKCAHPKWKKQMNTEKEHRALLQPLLQRRSDLVYQKRFLFFRPVGHYWRAVYFWKGRRREVKLLSLAFPLFAGQFVSFIWGGGMAEEANHRLLPPRDDPQRAAAEFSDFVEQEVLPCIAAIANPEEMAKRPQYGRPHLDPLFDACYYGDFDEAERRAVAYVNWHGPTHGHWGDHGYIREPYSIELATEERRLSDSGAWRVAYLARLLQTDRSQAPALLHDWEELTAKRFGLTEYWARTPFPYEK